MFSKIAQMMGFKKEQPENFIRRCVLVVDDNQTDLALIRKTVEKLGHRVLTAENGKIGLALARSEHPDLILSDCRMPVLDGVGMVKAIKTDPATKEIPIVFLTGDDTPSTVIECFDMGVQNYMCKPINPKLLATQIKAIFEEFLPV